MKPLLLIFYQEVWIVSTSAPQLPLLIEDALRSEDVEGTEADGTQRVRVNQVTNLNTT